MLLLKKTAKTTFGLFIFSIGYFLSIQANIGLAPWSAFGVGVSGATGISLGTVTIMTSMVIMVIDLILKEKIGIGTVLDGVLIGLFIDFFIWLNWVPMLNNFAAGIALLLFGQVLVSIGSYFYISPGLGCGPRGALMVALGKAVPKVPIGIVRIIIEGSALLVGWLLGAKVGIGTVIAVFGIGFILDYTFRILRFDVKSITHEDIITSFKSLVAKRA